MNGDQADVGGWFAMIQAEYREMPDLRLTKQEMQRLWGIEPTVCDTLIDALVAARVLRRTGSGRYVSHAAAA